MTGGPFRRARECGEGFAQGYRNSLVLEYWIFLLGVLPLRLGLIVQ